MPSSQDEEEQVSAGGQGTAFMKHNGVVERGGHTNTEDRAGVRLTLTE